MRVTDGCDDFVIEPPKKTEQSVDPARDRVIFGRRVSVERLSAAERRLLPDGGEYDSGGVGLPRELPTDALEPICAVGIKRYTRHITRMPASSCLEYATFYAC